MIILLLFLASQILYLENLAFFNNFYTFIIKYTTMKKSILTKNIYNQLKIKKLMRFF